MKAKKVIECLEFAIKQFGEDFDVRVRGACGYCFSDDNDIKFTIQYRKDRGGEPHIAIELIKD